MSHGHQSATWKEMPSAAPWVFGVCRAGLIFARRPVCQWGQFSPGVTGTFEFSKNAHASYQGIAGQRARRGRRQASVERICLRALAHSALEWMPARPSRHCGVTTGTPVWDSKLAVQKVIQAHPRSSVHGKLGLKWSWCAWGMICFQGWKQRWFEARFCRCVVWSLLGFQD